MQQLIDLLKLIPSLISAVQAAEQFVPIPGQGKTKLDFVLGVISDVYVDANKLIPQITAIVARIVALANATGVFKAPAKA